MYESHFGLKSRPFGSRAEGAAVFVGPRQNGFISSLHKGLAAEDAIVTVTGPVGVGKTTIVNRALASIHPNRTAAWVGRMKLGPDETLDLLLAGFGVTRQVPGSLRKFAVFRRLLAERAGSGAQVAIVVEDACRLGENALIELEALTAADAADGAGANIILMGQQGLGELLAGPELARMKQRNRQRLSVEPLNEAEVTGYLKHCIREAGSELDRIFEPGVAELVFASSGGIPRVINSLCESAMTAAAEDGLNRVSTALMYRIAVEDYGYEGPAPSIDAPPDPLDERPDDEAPPAVAVDCEDPARDISVIPGAATGEADEEDSSEDDLPPAARNIVVESGRYPELPDFEGIEDEISAAEDAPEASRSGESLSPEPDSVKADEQAASEKAAPVDKVPEPEYPGPSDALPGDREPQPGMAAQDDDEAPDVLEAKTDSTAIQEKPEGIDAVAANAAADDISPDDAHLSDDEAEDAVTPELSATPESSDADDHAANDADVDEDEKFDLDAALAIDLDETNLMEAATADIEAAASKLPDEEPAPAPDRDTRPGVDNLPTLSDSMRVDIGSEVERARDAEPAAVGGVSENESEQDEPPPERSEAPAQRVSEMTARIAAIDPGKRGSDVDALEAALEAAKKGELEDLMAAAPVAAPPDSSQGLEADGEATPAVPEITLDEKLAESQRMKPELEKFKEEIGKARSLEEFSDSMAETLFGSEEFDQIAAEVVANPPENHEVADPEPAGPSPVMLDEPLQQETTGTPAVLALEEEQPAELPDPGLNGKNELRESQVMRAAMLDSLNGSGEKIELGSSPQTSASSAKRAQPEPIEDQIDTVMTQTLQALNLPPPSAPGDDKKPKKSGGLFSRFRKSS